MEEICSAGNCAAGLTPEDLFSFFKSSSEVSERGQRRSVAIGAT